VVYGVGGVEFRGMGGDWGVGDRVDVIVFCLWVLEGLVCGLGYLSEQCAMLLN
jgi:hypothetical protein